MKLRPLWGLLAALMLLPGCAYAEEPVQTTVQPTTAPTTLPAAESAPPTTRPSVRHMSRAELAVQTFSEENALDASAYPDSLIALLERNPETEEFVLYYPLEYGVEKEVDLSSYETEEAMPLFLQWDRQWGYLDYGDDVAGLTACGPVCLSMVAYHFLRDPSVGPDQVIRFALDNGYCAPGNGSYWSLIDQGGAQLGLDVTAIYPEEDRVIANLEAGNPIICIMGPGDFTASGHFVVMAEAEDGLIRIHDPNSYENSQRLWAFADIADQIEGMWVMRYFG